MKPAPRRWEVPPHTPIAGIHPLLGRVLGARGIDAATAEALLGPPAPYHDPFGLAGMADAVIAIGRSISEGKRIAVYGDYDADGVTACAMLTLAFRRAGVDAIPYIPNRMSEGYGLHTAALEDLASQGAGCVITVDCGTSSVAVAEGRPAGMRLVITDHHLPLQPDGSLPALAPADALINPKQPDCSYPFDGLAGAGVAWKLLQALESEGLVRPGSADEALPLAALGTVADMMPLRGENRRLVRDGMLTMASIPGLAALCDIAGVSRTPRASDLGFGLGPRINAAGRMEDARLALELFLCDDEVSALPIAARLNAQNVERQQAVARALAEAEQRVAALPEDAPAIVLGDPGWPMGIVGLVAGRLCERYARPTFIACLDPTEAKGSARTIRSVHVVRALDGAAHTLLRYGGHAVAAGFSLDASRFDEFATAISQSVARQLGDAPRERVFTIDSEIRAGDVHPETCRVLDALEPCGQGNHQPTLMLRDVTVLTTRTFGAEKEHIGITVTDGEGIAEAIAFHKPGLQAHLPRGRRIDLCCGIELDSWRGQERVRLRLRDLRPAQPEVAAPVAADTREEPVLI